LTTALERLSSVAPAVVSSVEESFLGTLPPATVEILLDRATILEVSAGRLLGQPGDRPAVAVVVDGLVRLFLVSPSGRQVDVRYVSGGESMVAGALSTPATVRAQAITGVQLLLLDPAVLRALGQRDPRVAWAVAEEVGARLQQVASSLGDQVFGSVRQRVARTLLLRAAQQQQEGGIPTVRLTQQDLADAVGSVREVVSRPLREWAAAGVVTIGQGTVTLLEPAVLARAAQERD